MSAADGSQFSFDQTKIVVSAVEIIQMGDDTDAVHEIE
jgi:hypothetical protein